MAVNGFADKVSSINPDAIRSAMANRPNTTSGQMFQSDFLNRLYGTVASDEQQMKTMASSQNPGSVGMSTGPVQYENTLWNRLEQMYNSYMASLKASQASAMEAERQATLDANAFAEKMWQKTADFNASQNDLAYDRARTSAEKANQFSRSERLATQDWYENMSNTSYQRAMADMKKAGLNPILAYAQGGASSAMSSGASGQMANIGRASTSTTSSQKANMAGAKNADQKMATVYSQLVGNLASNIITSLFDGLTSSVKIAKTFIGLAK